MQPSILPHESFWVVSNLSLLSHVSLIIFDTVDRVPFVESCSSRRFSSSTGSFASSTELIALLTSSCVEFGACDSVHLKAHSEDAKYSILFVLLFYSIFYIFYSILILLQHMPRCSASALGTNRAASCSTGESISSTEQEISKENRHKQTASDYIRLR